MIIPCSLDCEHDEEALKRALEVMPELELILEEIKRLYGSQYKVSLEALLEKPPNLSDCPSVQISPVDSIRMPLKALENVLKP